MRAITIICIGLAAGLIMTLNGCSPGNPDGTAANAQAVTGTGNIQAVGAGIISVDAVNLTYTTKCSICGTEGTPTTVKIPSPKRPYKTSWTCPNCKHRHMIMFKSVNA